MKNDKYWFSRQSQLSSDSDKLLTESIDFKIEQLVKLTEVFLVEYDKVSSTGVRLVVSLEALLNIIKKKNQVLT